MKCFRRLIQGSVSQLEMNVIQQENEGDVLGEYFFDGVKQLFLAL